MTKLLTIYLLLASIFIGKAQDLNFNETVKYINDKIACCAEDHFTVKADTSGKLTWASSQINLFDLASIKMPTISEYNSTYEEVMANSNGIVLYRDNPRYYIYFYKSGDAFLFNRFQTQIDAERVYKALQHLRSLCTKVKDPFD